MTEYKMNREQEAYVKLGETSMGVKVHKVLRELRASLTQEMERRGSLSTEQQAQLDLLSVIDSKVTEKQLAD